MKHSFAIWATLFGVTGAAAQVSTQLGNTPYPPDMVVERSITTNKIILNGTASGSTSIFANSTGNLGLNVPTGGFFQANGVSVGSWNSVGLSMGGPGTVNGQINLNGTTSGSGSISVNNVGAMALNVPTGQAGALGVNNVQTLGWNNAGVNVTPGILTLGANGTATGSVGLSGATSGTATLTTGATAGHLSITSSSVPTANSCAGFALGTGSSDTAGRVAYTSATTCSITFGTAYTNAPFCTITPGSAASTVEVVTTTGGLTATFGTANTAFYYYCLGT